MEKIQIRLNKLTKDQLEKICKRMKIKYPKKKQNIVNRLLNPLKSKYRVAMALWTEDENEKFIPEEVVREVGQYLTPQDIGRSIVNVPSRWPGKLTRNDPRREILRERRDKYTDLKEEYHRHLRKYNLKKLESMGYDDPYTFKDSYKFVMWMLEKKLPLNDILKIANDPLSHYYFTKNDLLEKMERILVISSGTSTITGYNNVKSLLKVKDLDVNKITKNGNIALHTAINEDNQDMVELLLERKDLDVNKTGDKIDGNNVEGNGSTPLYLACHIGNPEIVKLLLKRKDIDVNKTYFGAPPLYFAVQKNDPEIVKLLLKRKDTDVNKTYNGVTPLDKACHIGNPEIVELLLKRTDIDVNKTGDFGPPLYYAVERNYPEIVELLLKKKGIDVNKRYNGVTPLYNAVERNYPEIVELLLKKKGIDVNKTGDFGQTPLDKALLDRNEEITELLKTHGGKRVYKK